jgi:hypothetical protein
MLKINNDLLVEVGLGSLPDSDKNGFLKHIYETLEMRVGIRLADQMSNKQLDEFERYFEAKDDAGAFHWLETNFPNYKEIVQQEFDKLKNEMIQNAPQILAASQGQAMQQTLSQPKAPPPSSETLPSQSWDPSMTSQSQPSQHQPVPPQYPSQPPYPTEQPPADPLSQL